MQDPAPALIDLRGVTKRFGMGGREVRALDTVDLAIAAGEFVAVMGPSGSGKSTLLNVLGCLDRPSEGAYLLDGEDLGSASVRRRARVRNTHLGFIFQEFNLLRRSTALENVELPLLYRDATARQRRERALDALSSVGLADRADHLPTQLSGGEQQRVAIARALVGRPNILLADEPTGSLDSRTGDQVMAILTTLGDMGMTIVLVTHDPAVAEHARRLIQMRDGAVVSDSGPAAEPAPPGSQDALFPGAVGRDA